MNLVYIFLNNSFNNNCSEKKTYSYSSVPPYYFNTIKFNSKYADTIYFLLQESEIEKIKQPLPSNVQLISIEKEILPTIEYRCLDDLLNKNWSRYKEEVFLYHAFLRLLLLVSFIQNKKLNNTLHIEADVLLYQPLKNLQTVVPDGHFAYPALGYNVSSPGIIYFKDVKAGENLYRLFEKLLSKTEYDINSSMGIYLDYITDMNFLELIRLYNKNYFMLPILPGGEFGENCDRLGILFDPASYGQYLGGTNNGHSPGFIGHDHFIAPFIMSKTIEIKFENSTPFIMFNDQKILLANLHMHNKQNIPQFINE